MTLRLLPGIALGQRLDELHALARRLLGPKVDFTAKTDRPYCGRDENPKPQQLEVSVTINLDDIEQAVSAATVAPAERVAGAALSDSHRGDGGASVAAETRDGAPPLSAWTEEQREAARQVLHPYTAHGPAVSEACQVMRQVAYLFVAQPALISDEEMEREAFDAWRAWWIREDNPGHERETMFNDQDRAAEAVKNGLGRDSFMQPTWIRGHGAGFFLGWRMARALLAPAASDPAPIIRERNRALSDLTAVREVLRDAKHEHEGESVAQLVERALAKEPNTAPEPQPRGQKET